MFKKGTALVPTFVAFAVTQLLEGHFERLVDYDFTARMEDDLDRIAAGQEARVEWLQRFYFGRRRRPACMRSSPSTSTRSTRARSTRSPIPGSDVVVRVGRYGPYLERGDERASLPHDVAPDELTAEKAEELLSKPSGDRAVGIDPRPDTRSSSRTGATALT